MNFNDPRSIYFSNLTGQQRQEEIKPQINPKLNNIPEGSLNSNLQFDNYPVKFSNNRINREGRGEFTKVNRANQFKQEMNEKKSHHEREEEKKMMNLKEDERKYKPDWICPNDSCRNRNFAKREYCNLCKQPKPKNPMYDYSEFPPKRKYEVKREGSSKRESSSESQKDYYYKKKNREKRF